MFGCFYFIVAVEKPVNWVAVHYRELSGWVSIFNCASNAFVFWLSFTGETGVSQGNKAETNWIDFCRLSEKPGC